MENLERVLKDVEEYVYRYQCLPTSIVSIRKFAHLVVFVMRTELLTPFEHNISQISSWPNRERGEDCLREIALIDEFLKEAPVSQPICDEHEISIKSSMIKDEKMKSMIIVNVIVEYSEEYDEDLDEDVGEIPIQLWR